MSYCLSTNIGIFPTAGRPTLDPWGRLTTEYNLTSMVNTLLGVDGFVITDPGAINKPEGSTTYNDAGSNSISGGKFQFNIKGYIFTIFDIGSIISSFSDANNGDFIYAAIKIKNEAGNPIYNTASGENSNKYYMQLIEGRDVIEGEYKDQYTGVVFTNNTTNNDGYIYLKILEKIGENWYIPDESKIKFKTNKSGSQRSISIDDGELS